MSSIRKRGITLILTVLMVIGLFSGCGKKVEKEGKDDNIATTQAAKNEKKTVVKIGTHFIKGEDPTYKDPVTGQSAMDPVKLNARLTALQKAEKELNIDIKYVPYSKSVQEEFLSSVLANDPVCDIGGIPWGPGIIIAQNVLQPLDEYKDMFKDPEYSWMYTDKVYGHNYLLATGKVFASGFNLVYNLNYIENVDTLKENGKTVYPTDLWKQGKWTWSTFEDYLTKLKAYYANKKAPVRTEVSIQAYTTDVMMPATALIKTTGQAIFDSKGMGVDTPDARRAVAYVDDLVSKKLLNPVTNYSENTRKDAFKNGETVFTDLAQWSQASAGEELAKRGESLGIIPYPRPDDIPADDSRYKPLVQCSGMGVLKGISKEQTELTLKMAKVYFCEIFKLQNNTDSIAEYFKSDEAAKEQAALHGQDVSHKNCGNDIVAAYKAYCADANEFYTLTPWFTQYQKLLRNSIMGLDGTPKYEAAIAAEKQVYQEQNDKINSITSSDKIVDNIAPTISLVSKEVALAKGTDSSKIDWSKYLKASDNIDGDIDIKKITIDTSKVKFDTVGKYDKGLVATVKDKEGNEKKAEINVMIFDPNNKKEPTLIEKSQYRVVKKDEDASKINWGKDFIDKAESAEGFDIKSYVTADISSLDVTKAGKYDVVISVTDYAGNKAEKKIAVTVVEK